MITLFNLWDDAADGDHSSVAFPRFHLQREMRIRTTMERTMERTRKRAMTRVMMWMRSARRMRMGNSY